MGDRGNIAVVQRDGGLIFLYTHWGGSSISDDLRTALARRQRWDDGPYLTRIIFDEMAYEWHGTETGFGISTDICDNEHDILVVNPNTQKVYVNAYESYPNGYRFVETDTGVSFEDFVNYVVAGATT